VFRPFAIYFLAIAAKLFRGWPIAEGDLHLRIFLLLLLGPSRHQSQVFRRPMEDNVNRRGMFIPLTMLIISCSSAPKAKEQVEDSPPHTSNLAPAPDLKSASDGGPARLGILSSEGTSSTLPPPPASISIQLNGLQPKFVASSEHSKEKYLEPVESIFDRCTISGPVTQAEGLAHHFNIFFFESSDGAVEKVQIDTSMPRDSNLKACIQRHLKTVFKLKGVAG
jgi:hypothetical protein